MKDSKNVPQYYVDNFSGKYECFSNAYTCNIEFNGKVYTNAEAAFQAQKCPERADEFVGLNAKKAHKLGQTVDLPLNWREVRTEIMYRVLIAKFYQNNDLRRILDSTGYGNIINSNVQKDKTWGNYKNEGFNLLGETLMRVRDDLRAHYRWKKD